MSQSQGSSVASSQMSGSKASASSSTRSGRGTLEQRFGLYALFQQHELHVNWKYSAAGLAVMYIQLLGFIINPSYKWGSVMQKPVGQILYFFTSPFYDPNWVPGDTEVLAHVTFWLGLVLMALLFTGICVNATSEHQTIPQSLQKVTKNIIHGASSVLLVPITMSTLSFMVCDKHRRNLFWFANEDCTGSVASAYFAVGSILLLFLVVAVNVATATLYEEYPQQGAMSLMGRATSLTALSKVWVYVALSVCYHVLISKELPQVFAGVMVALCYLHSFQYAFHLPFFNMKMNRWMSAAHLSAGTVALVVAIGPRIGKDFEGTNYQTLAAVVAAVLSFVIGLALPSIRVSSKFAAAMADLNNGDLEEENERLVEYPRGLPVNDLVFSRHKQLERDINPNIDKMERIAQGLQTESEEDEDEEEEIIGLRIPFIHRVYIPSDVELATRFLVHFKDTTDNHPTDSMNGTASRIFTKGMARFRRDAGVIHHFTNFLTHFAFRLRLALAESEQIAKYDPGFALKYRTHRLQVSLKSSLNMADTNHLKLFNSTLRLHKEIIGHMSMFWAKLLGNTVDTVQLAGIANSITTKRESAHNQFQRVLQHANGTVLNRYARFLEQVMIDPNSAKVIRDQLAEQRESRMTQGKKPSGGVSGVQSLGKSITNSISARLQAQNKAGDSSRGSTTIARMSLSMNFVFTALLLLVIALFVYEVVRSNTMHVVVDRLYAAGRTRTLASLGSFYVKELDEAIQGHYYDANGLLDPAFTVNSTLLLATIASLQTSLGAVAAEFETHHATLTHGSLRPTYDTHINYINRDLIEILEPDNSGTSLSGDYRRLLVNLFNLGNRIGATFNKIATTNNTQELSNAFLKFFALNSVHSMSTAFDKNLNLFEQQVDEYNFMAQWSAVGIFALGLLVVFIVYCIMILNFNKIGQSKLSTLNLFTLIPRIHLEGLQKNTQEMLDKFDEEDAVSCDPSLGGGASEDGRMYDDLGQATNKHPSGGKKDKPRGNKVAPEENAMELAKSAENGGEGVEQKGFKAAWESGYGGNPNGEHAKDGNAQSTRSSIAGELDSLAGDSEVDDGEENKDASKQSGGLSLMDVLSGVGLVASILVILAVALATFILILRLDLSVKQTESTLETIDRYGSLQKTMYRSMLELSRAARLYTQSGDQVYLKHYRDLINSRAIETAYQDLVDLEENEAMLQQFLQQRTILDDLLYRQKVAIALVADATNISGTVAAQYVQSVESYNFTKLRPIIDEVFYSFVMLDPPYRATDNVKDMSLTPEQKFGAARSLLFSDLYDAHFELYERLRIHPQEIRRDEVEQEETRRRNLFVAALVLYSVCLMIMGMWFSQSSTAGLLRIVGGTGLILITGSMVVLCFLFVTAPKVEDAFDRVNHLYSASNHSFAALSFVDSYARGFSQWGNKFDFHRYDDVVRKGEWEISLNQLLSSILTSKATSLHDQEQAVRDALELRRKAETIFSYGETAVVQTIWSQNYSGLAEFSSVEHVIYSREREEGHEADYILHGTDPAEYYTNSSSDAKGGSTALNKLAIATLSNQKHRSSFNELVSKLDDFVSNGISIAMKEADGFVAVLHQLSTTTIVLSAITLVLLVMIGMYVTFSTIYHMANNSGEGKAGSGASSTVKQTKSSSNMFENLLNQTQVALVAMLLVMIAVFAMDVVHLMGSKDTIHDLNLASSREWSVLRSANYAQRVWYGSNDDVAEKVFSNLASELETIRARLYMGHPGEGYNVLKISAQHNTEQFGHSTYNMEVFNSECFVGSPAAAASTAATPAAATQGALFPDGVDAGYIAWILRLKEMGHAPNRTAALQLRHQMMQVAVPLSDELLLSTVFLHDNAHSAINQESAIHHTLTAALALLILLTFFGVFKPMINHLLNEEEGTRMLLRMIPQRVRQDVPAIAEYLETGSITQNEKMQRINQAVTDLSVVSLIVINQAGIVQRISRATQDIFGYEEEEIVGQNIKMLMPESIAIKHDGYLSSYQKTGIKKVVDQIRRLNGRHKDGHTFPLETSVKEFRISATESNFLGFLRNIATEVKFEKAIRLNEAVSDMSHIPVVVINPAGSIFRVNRAACETFQYSAAEVQNKNIKMLMPMKYARDHDKKLAEYQRTRVKNVIDSSRNLTAIRRNMEEFPVQLTIREMLSDRGQTQYFVGYVRDITRDLLFQQSVMANDAVIAISPTPVISISPTGIINIFSPAASKAWGWAPEEIIGRNIRLIMNDDDAKRHDNYLSTYMKTGVKSIIDSTRAVTAKRKNGELFTAEVNVKELRVDDHVSFIGYIKDKTEQLKAEHENHTNEVAFNACPLPVICMNSVGIVQRFNMAGEKLFGYRSEQVIGQNIKMLQPPEIAAVHDGYLERYRETGVKNIIDSKRRTHARVRSGKMVSVEIQVREVIVDDIMSATGKRAMFIGYIRDVSEEMRMIKANELNDAITDLCTVPMISIDKKGTILTFSEAASKTFGYSTTEVIGQNVKMLMPEQYSKDHDQYLDNYNRTGIKKVIDTEREASAMRKDGSVFPVCLKVKEINKQGMDTVFVANLRDTTQEILVEDAQNLVRTIVGTSPIPIIGINTQGIVQVFSNEAEKVLGWPSSEIVGKNVKLLMPQEIARKHDGFLKQYKKTGIKSIIDSQRNVTAQRRDGLTIACEIVVKEVRKESDKGSSEVPDSALYVGYLRDKSQEYILRQSNELKDVILKESSIPMIQIDTVGTIIFVNPALCHEFQYSVDELMGQNIKMLTPKHIAEQHDYFLKRYLDTGVKHVIDTTRKVSAIRHDGTEFPIEISVREMDVEGKKTYFGYIRNTTNEMRIHDQRHTGDVIIEKSEIPLITISTKGTVITFNEAATKTFGYEKNEVLGKNIKMLMPPEIANIHDDYLSNYLKYKQKSVIDSTRRAMGKRKNGRNFPVELMIRELAQSSGYTNDSVAAYVGYCRDVTDEHRLRIANELADTVSNLSPIPLIAMSPKGILLKFSKAAEELFGYNATEVLGQNIKMLQPSEVAANHDNYLKNYMRTGVKAVVDTTRTVEAKLKDGTLIPAEITVREIKKAGAEHTFIAFLKDMRDSIRQQRMSDITLTIQNLMPQPLITMDDMGTIQDVNFQVTKLLGYESHECENQNIKMLMPEEIAVNHDGYLEAYRRTGVKTIVGSKREITAKHKDGTIVPVEIMVTELRSEELKRTFFFGFLRDLRGERETSAQYQMNEMVTSLALQPIIAINIKGVIMKFSRSASAEFGYEPQEVIGQNIKMLMPESIAKNHDGYLSRYLETGVKKVIDTTRHIEGKRKSGKTFPAELNVCEVPMKGTNNNLYVGFLKNMETVQEAETIIRITSTISHLTGLAMFMINAKGIIQQCNQGATKVLGYEHNEMMGKNIKMLMTRSTADRHDGYLATFQRTGKKRVIDNVVRQSAVHKNGEEMIVEIGVKELDIEGVGQRFVGFVRNVSQDVKLEKADVLNATIIGLSPVPIILIDSIGVMLKCSRLAQEMFRAKNESEMVGKNVKSIMPSSVAVNHDRYLQKYLDTGIKTIVDKENKIVAKRMDGSEFDAVIYVKEVAGDDGEKYFLGYIRE